MQERVVIIVGSLLLLSGITAPPAVSSAAVRETSIALQAVASPQALATAYTLPVVAVPPPPGLAWTRFGAISAAAVTAASEPPRAAFDESRCPVAVRAIVRNEADGCDASFAVVAVGQDSRVMRAGQSLRMGGVTFVVRDISQGAVTFMRGDVAVRCALSGSVMR